jgi:hypothetical protein
MKALILPQRDLNVAYDPQLDPRIEYVDIHEEKVAEYLSNIGVTEAAIAATTIHVWNIGARSAEGGLSLAGARPRHVDVFLGSFVMALEEVGYPQTPDEIRSASVNISYAVSKKLVHELTHVAQYEQGQIPLDLAELEALPYLQRPWEQEAFAAEDAYVQAVNRREQTRLSDLLLENRD